MSLAGLNARHGSTVTVYRPTVGDDSVSWGSAVFDGVKLELLPMTDEVARDTFGADARVECMVLTTLDVRKSDGIVVTGGTYAGAHFRVQEAKPFRRFTQLGLVRTTEPMPDPVAAPDTTPAYLALTPVALALAVSETAQVAAVVWNAAQLPLPDALVAYESADEEVATVDANGLVTAVGEGETVITATAESASDTSTVTVAAP